MNLLHRIERCLARSGISASQFGREAMNDPAFVSSMRRGRDPTEATIERVSAYIKRVESAPGAGSSDK